MTIMKSNWKTSIAIVALLAVLAAFFGIRALKHDPRTRYEAFLKAAYEKTSPLLRQEGTEKAADQPEMAALHDYFTTVDPSLGRVPLERLWPAVQKTREASVDARLKSSADPLQWEIVPSNMGGRTRCITFDPNDPSGHKIWAGAVTGGLWKHEDITQQLYWWEPVADFWPGLSISAIEFDPNDPQTMYVGTGEAFTSVTIYRESSGLGVGIFKSTNGGESWELLPSTEDWRYVTDIEVRDEDGISVIYAGVVSGLYKGMEHESQPTDGLYRSIDGGSTWFQVLPLIPGSDKPFAPSDIELAADGRLFVGTMRNLDGEGAGCILRSDQGLIGSWTVYDDYVSVIENDPQYYIPGRVMIASAPSDPDVVYALFDAGYVQGGTGFILSQGRHILRSSDGGEGWTVKSIPSGGNYFWATLGWHALTAAVDPNNSDHVYIGGLDVYKTFNGGDTWIQVSDWVYMYYGGGDEYVHADIHDIDFMPGSSLGLAISSDGGVFYTPEATAGDPAFQEKNMLYGSLQFYTCAIHPTAGLERYVGGLQDNGTLYYTGSPLDINDMIDGGDGAYCFIDENEPQFMYTSVYYNQYTAWYNGNYYNSMSDWESGIFINPAALDYKLNILFANATEYDGNYPNQLLRIIGLPNYPYGSFVTLDTYSDTWFSYVGYSPYSPELSSTLFLGTASGWVYKVTEAQLMPETDEITGLEFPEANVSCIAIGGSEDTLMVTFSNYGVSSVWQTYDGGANWSEIEGNLPDIPVRWALYHPQNRKQAMLATETGIWTTTDVHQQPVTWVPDNENLANVRVDMLQMRSSDNTVLIATHGRGLATATWDIFTGTPEGPARPSFTIYPNPSLGQFRLSLASSTSGPLEISVFNAAGSEVYHQLLDARNDQPGHIIDLGSCAPGEYFARLTLDGRAWTEKLIISR